MSRTFRTLSLSLPPSAELALKERGKKIGKTAARVAAMIVLRELEKPAGHGFELYELPKHRGAVKVVDVARVEKLELEMAKLRDDLADLTRRLLAAVC
jgi:hypothetical protein